MKIRCKSPAGSTLYAIVRRDSDGQVWDNVASGWEAWLDGDVGDYDVPLTDHGGDYYTATFPAGISVGAAVYDVLIYKQAGGSPAITDLILTSYALVPDVNVNQVSNDATAADNLELACDNYSAERGLSGTALPAAAADAAGGLPISDAGGLDLDAMNTNVNDIETDTNSLNDTKIPDTISLANINAEVDTALATTTYAEPGQGAPAATASLKDKIGYLYKAWRNRSNQTSTTYQLFADDATTVDQKATVSDDATTAEKGEIATGP